MLSHLHAGLSLTCFVASLSHPSAASYYLPSYHELIHGSFADCTLKGDDLTAYMYAQIEQQELHFLLKPRSDREMHPQLHVHCYLSLAARVHIYMTDRSE